MTGPLFETTESTAAPSPRWLPVPRYRLSLVRESTDQVDGAAWADPLSSPAAVARLVWTFVEHEPAEVVGALYLDSRHRLIGSAAPYRGTLAGAMCEPRGVLVPALLCNAAALVLFHNHPSGDPMPSAQDLAFTRRLAEAGEVLGVRMLDHIILGAADRWVSLRERGVW